MGTKSKEYNDIQTAIEQLEKAEAHGNIPDISECLSRLADIYDDNDLSEMAIAVCQKNIDMLVDTNYKQQLATAYLNQGIYYGRKYYFAYPCLKKARDIFQQLDDVSSTASANYYLGRITLRREIAIKKRYETAKDYFSTAAEQYASIKDLSFEALCLTSVGECLIGLDKLKEAEQALEKAVDEARRMNEPEILDDALYQLARAYYYGEKFFKGQKILEEAIDINRKSKDYYDLAYMLLAYGKILASLEKYDLAINAFKESEHIKRAMGDIDDIEEVIFWLGKTAFAMDNLQDALLYFQEEVALRESKPPLPQNITALTNAQGNLAFVCMKLGYIHDAITQYKNKYRALSDSDEDAAMRGICLCELADAYEANNNYDIAISLYQKAIEEYKLALRNQQLEDASTIDIVNSKIDELSAKKNQAEDELPGIEVPQVYTPEIVSNVIISLIADKFQDNETKRPKIGFAKKNQQNISEKSTFEELGIEDRRSELLMDTEELFDIQFFDEELEDFKTVGDIINVVVKKVEI